ncbi:MAG: GTP 3',8-cyclase MoaA [Porticoccaceae bacterium]|nr:GTP 3',8-cyclase MoaA [Porticoccaceae bacterium]MDG1474228.1 GTP 3',8-cyclase MoaA [Porticoccaceae bacterium]
MDTVKKTTPVSLIDPFGRSINYLRLSVTDRCNLRCTYCMAEDMTFLPRQQILSLEELRDVAAAFVALGVEKIRLTGGEPLIRRDIIKLVSSISCLPGLKEVTMTTNGMLLPKMAESLKDAGLARLNISIDSLHADRFKEITRNGDLALWHRGISAAKKAGFVKIKLNAVILAGFNDHEVLDLARYAVDNELDISFIEEMPLGAISSHERAKTQISSEKIRQQLVHEFSLVNSLETTGGPSRYMQVIDSPTKIGFISPMTNNFCGSCNRVRVTAEGRLLLCLGNEHSMDLRDILRRNPGDYDLLKSKILEALQNKPERHHFDPNRTDIVRFMNMTGG